MSHNAAQVEIFLPFPLNKCAKSGNKVNTLGVTAPMPYLRGKRKTKQLPLCRRKRIMRSGCIAR